MCAEILSHHDWNEFRSRISEASTVGFLFMVPGDYQRGEERTRHLSDMAGDAIKMVAARRRLLSLIERDKEAMAGTLKGDVP
jgi:hypothetical protein